MFILDVYPRYLYYMFILDVITASHVCEHGGPNTMKLSCPGTKQIRIKFANYGRRSATQCTKINVGVTNCVSRNSMAKVKESCERKHYCRLTASNNIFGDPCRGVTKYLEVSYRCM